MIWYLFIHYIHYITLHYNLGGVETTHPSVGGVVTTPPAVGGVETTPPAVGGAEHPNEGAVTVGDVVKEVASPNPLISNLLCMFLYVYLFNMFLAVEAHAGVGMPTVSPPTFKDMLSPDYFALKSETKVPDMNTFHKTAGAPVLTSGKFHTCSVHSDCFKYREPREWCQNNSHGSWT